MSKFYGSCCGNRGVATRGGSRDSGYKTTAQSYDGSVNVELFYDRHQEEENQDTLQVRISLADDSSCWGDTYFRGSFKELKEALKAYTESKAKGVHNV